MTLDRTFHVADALAARAGPVRCSVTWTLRSSFGRSWKSAHPYTSKSPISPLLRTIAGSATLPKTSSGNSTLPAWAVRLTG